MVGDHRFVFLGVVSVLLYWIYCLLELCSSWFSRYFLLFLPACQASFSLNLVDLCENGSVCPLWTAFHYKVSSVFFGSLLRYVRLGARRLGAW